MWYSFSNEKEAMNKKIFIALFQIPGYARFIKTN